MASMNSGKSMYNIGESSNLMNLGNLNKDISMDNVNNLNSSNPSYLNNCSLLASAAYSMQNEMRKKINYIFFIQVICILLICAILVLMNISPIYNKNIQKLEVIKK